MREAPALILLAVLGAVAAASLLAMRPVIMPVIEARAPAASIISSWNGSQVVIANPYGAPLAEKLWQPNATETLRLHGLSGVALKLGSTGVYRYSGCILPGDNIDLVAGTRRVNLEVFASDEVLRERLGRCGARLLTIKDLAGVLNESASGAVARVYNSTTLLLDGFGRGSWRVDIDADYAVFRVEGLGGLLVQRVSCWLGGPISFVVNGVVYQGCNACIDPNSCVLRPPRDGWYVAARPFYIGVYSRYQYAEVPSSTTIAFVEKMLYKNYYRGVSRTAYSVYAWASLARGEAEGTTIVWLDATGVTSVNISGVVYRVYIPGWAEESAVIRDEAKGITLHVVTRGDIMVVHPLSRYPSRVSSLLAPFVYYYYWWYPNITGYVDSIVDPYWLAYTRGAYGYPWPPVAEAALVTFRYVVFNSGPVIIRATPTSVVCLWIDYDHDSVRDIGEVACTWTRDGRVEVRLPRIDAYNATVWVASTASGAPSLAVLPGGGLEATSVDIEGLVLNATLPGGSLEVEPGTVVYAEAACTTSLTLIDSAGHRIIVEPGKGTIVVALGSRSETLPCSGGYRIYWLASLVTIETGEASTSIPYTAPVGTVRLEADGDA